MLEATSASTRQRVRIYRNDENGAEKLLIRFAPHALPACFPQGKCACRTCKKMVRDGNVTRHADGGREGEFPTRRADGPVPPVGAHERRAEAAVPAPPPLPPRAGDVLAHAHIPVERSPAARRDGEGEQSREGVRGRLRRGDPLAVFVASIVAFASLAFSLAVLAWWAEYGSALILQSMRDPPRNWEEAWRMRGLFQRTISSSLEKSLGLEAGTLPGVG